MNYSFQIVDNEESYKQLITKSTTWLQNEFREQKKIIEIKPITKSFYSALEQYSFSNKKLLSKRIIHFVYNQDIPTDIEMNQDDIDALCENSINQQITLGYIFILLDEFAEPLKLISSTPLIIKC
ncbi:MAG: hypothetical protein KA319_00305 [Ferruginibacter sp.]|nr:hypothetical protein [Ferruginibacter sp.]